MNSDTDDEYQVRAAAENKKWLWPSDMHKCGTIKTNTKDGMILLLVLFQKLFRNNYGERPLMALYGFSVAASGLLIFFIGSNYWGNQIGFWLMMLYLLSVWPWQTALYGGHVGIATMAFLASILTIQQISYEAPNFFILIGVGVLFCFMLFSSGSSTKYIPLFFAGLISSRFLSVENGTVSMIIDYVYTVDYKLDILVLISIGVAFILTKTFKKQIVDALYYDKSPLLKRLKIIEGQQLFPKEHYYKHANKKIPKYFKNLIIIYIGLSAIVHFIGWSYLFPFLLGFLMLFLTLTLPDVKLNTKNYLRHILSPVRKTRFEKYIPYFAKRGMDIKPNFRAPLLKWLPRVAWRVAPLQTLLLAGLFLITFSNFLDLTAKIFIILASSLPVLWGELTGTTRSLRTYSPSLMGIFVFLGYSASHINWPNLEMYLVVSAIAIGTHQAWIFFSDVYPARMAIPNLIDALDKNNIKEFYTYETSYNDTFANYISDKYKIHRINSLSDIKKGWIIIPPTNSKSLSMECVQEAMNGDYTKDPKLNELLFTEKIEQLAAVKFKTFSSSKIWPQEADVATYMDLILKEVGKKERFRGYAWLINAEKLTYI